MLLKFNHNFSNLLESLYTVSSHRAWVQILALPLTSCVLLRKLLNTLLVLCLYFFIYKVQFDINISQGYPEGGGTDRIYIGMNVDRDLL